MKNYIFASLCAMLFMAIGFNATASSDVFDNSDVIITVCDYDYAPDVILMDDIAEAPDVFAKHEAPNDVDDVSTATVVAINSKAFDIGERNNRTSAKRSSAKRSSSAKARKYKRKNNRKRNNTGFPGASRSKTFKGCAWSN